MAKFYLSRLGSFSIGFLLTLSQITSVQANTRYSTDPDAGPCVLIGDDAQYGLGIRWSFYLTWAGALIIMVFGIVEERNMVRKASNAVALAVMTDLFMSLGKGSFAQVEAGIVFNFIVLAILTTAPGSIDELTEHAVSFGITLLIYAVYGLSLPWFYFPMLRQGYKPGCVTYIASPTLKIETFNTKWILCMKVMSIIGCIVCAVLVVPTAAWFLHYGIKNAIKGKTEDKAETEDENAEHATERKYIDWGIRGMMTLISLLFGVFAIIAVERNISMNHIVIEDDSLMNAAQSFPFIVGLGALLSCIWAVFKKFFEHKKVPQTNSPVHLNDIESHGPSKQASEASASPTPTRQPSIDITDRREVNEIPRA